MQPKFGKGRRTLLISEQPNKWIAAIASSLGRMLIILQSIATTKHFHGCKAASTQQMKGIQWIPLTKRKVLTKFLILVLALSCILPCTILDSQTQFPVFF